MESRKRDQMGTCLESAIRGIGPNESVLLASDVLDYWEHYADVIHRIVVFPMEYRLIHCSSGEEVLGSAQGADDLLSYVSNDFFAECILFGIPDAGVSIYNDPSSNLSLLRAGAQLLQPYVDAWDARFCSHIKGVGVGFGADGRRFVGHLIADVATQLPLESLRFDRLSQCAVG